MKALLSVLVLFGFMGIANAQEGGEAPAGGAEMNGGETREPARAHHKKTKKKKHAKKTHKGM